MLLPAAFIAIRYTISQEVIEKDIISKNTNNVTNNVILPLNVRVNLSTYYMSIVSKSRKRVS